MAAINTTKPTPLPLPPEDDKIEKEEARHEGDIGQEEQLETRLEQEVVAQSRAFFAPFFPRSRFPAQEAHLAQEEDAKKVNGDDVKAAGKDLQAETSLENQIAGEELQVSRRVDGSACVV